MSAPDPILEPIAIVDLRPTQVTVGMREVALKQRAWRERDSKRKDFFGRHLIPVVIGPAGRLYIIDHHHLALALRREGVEEALVSITADLEDLPKAAFWTYLDNVGWCHSYDPEGLRVEFDRIPKCVDDLADDAYRSLAGALRRAGGYAKNNTPFAEFLWADFLRRTIDAKDVDKRFDAALTEARRLAATKAARYLPGWCGPDGEI